MTTEEWPAVRGLRVILKNTFATTYLLPNDEMLKVDTEFNHIMYSQDWTDWWRLLADGRDQVKQFMKEVTTEEELITRRSETFPAQHSK